MKIWAEPQVFEHKKGGLTTSSFSVCILIGWFWFRRRLRSAWFWRGRLGWCWRRCRCRSWFWRRAGGWFWSNRLWCCWCRSWFWRNWFWSYRSRSWRWPRSHRLWRRWCRGIHICWSTQVIFFTFNLFVSIRVGHDAFAASSVVSH